MAQAHSNEVLDEDTQQYIRKIFQQKLEHREELQPVVRIIIIGKAFVGKSYFINQYLGYPENDANAPKYGRKRGQKTTDITEYERKEELPGIKLFDAPGLDCENKFMSAKKYCEKRKLDNYDLIIIMCSGRFDKTEIDIYY